MRLQITDEIIEIDRELKPDVYEKIDDVAKIIMPEAFVEDVHIEPASANKRFRIRQEYMQAVARRKANDVLTYLGFSTETDWYEILNRMADKHAKE